MNKILKDNQITVFKSQFRYIIKVNDKDNTKTKKLWH